MKNTPSMPRPPITQLRPLHSHQQSSDQELEAPLSEVQYRLDHDPQLLHRPSPLKPRPDEDTTIKAFVKLVSRIVILDPGEAYCIQDSARGGFILARSVSAGPDEEEEGAFSFIDCEDGHDIPTDFSIGEGKALQLHIDVITKQVRLTAQANIIPSAALEALGRMLDDLILGLQQDQGQTPAFVPPGAELLKQPAGPRETALDFLVCLERGKRIKYTYQQVENTANALAAKLVRTCARSQSQPSIKTVAVLMGPCPELYISYLAALKAGMAFCPIPVDAPEERKGALIADLKPAALVVAASTQPGMRRQIGKTLISIIIRGGD
ncbi:AMP-binding enzyme [Hirsutella rhossiliensis]|uniref:AMP-binding enzyme domain-containing protein n=1 Tax=Hirsutella rhossiliensis TaxID=111463 RepID=A0A9P8N2L5_9HYPO|nr:AMP-binding enzyme domain-containing protein [Hirsutella rhossiliensis]KAH0967133.1 AMP-binding enzyme domain-containing protein [Hirsutella rhossiliensis]